MTVQLTPDMLKKNILSEAIAAAKAEQPILTQPQETSYHVTPLQEFNFKDPLLWRSVEAVAGEGWCSRKMAAKSDLMICPYDKSQEIEREWMQFHLTKCAKNFPKQEMAACCYNNLHRVPKVELSYYTICSDKKKLDTFMHEIGDTSCPVKDMVPINEGSPKVLDSR